MDGLGGSVGTSCSKLFESRSRHCKGGAIDSQANSVESAYYRHQRFDPDRIREVRAYYLQFLAGHDFIVELGCGRGEFLELLKDSGKRTLGVDSDPGMVAETQSRGLDVVLQDAVTFVETTGEAPDALFAAHLVEHLSVDGALRLFTGAEQCLRPGGSLVVVTPNPQSLAVILSDFWNDPTHVRPYTIPLLEFIAKQAGLQPVESGFNLADEPGPPPTLRVPETLPPWGSIQTTYLPPWAEDQLDEEGGVNRVAFGALLQRVYDVNGALFEHIKVLEQRIDQVRHQAMVASNSVNTLLAHLWGPNEIFMVAKKA